MGSDFYYVPDSPFKPINLARADEFENLIAIAVDCGFGKNPELFDKISVMVYGESNRTEKFTETMKNIMESFFKSITKISEEAKPAQPNEEQ